MTKRARRRRKAEATAAPVSGDGVFMTGVEAAVFIGLVVVLVALALTAG